MGGIAILGVAAALAAQPAATSRYELSLGADVGYQDFTGPGDAHTVLGDAGLTLTIFAPRRVVDDDAPYALQPFLQRAGRIWLGVAGGGSDLAFTNLFSPGAAETHSHASGGAANAGFDVYVHRWVALDASFTVDGAHYADADGTVVPTDTLNLHGTAGLALRWRDLRFDVGYRIDGARGTFRSADGENNQVWGPVFYGHVVTSAQAVVRRLFALAVQIDVLDHGAAVWGSASAYPTKRVGLMWGLGGGRTGAGTNFPTDHAAAQLGISFWRSRRFGVSAAYSLSWTKMTSYEATGFFPGTVASSSATTQHLFSLALLSRL